MGSRRATQYSLKFTFVLVLAPVWVTGSCIDAAPGPVSDRPVVVDGHGSSAANLRVSPAGHASAGAAGADSAPARRPTVPVRFLANEGVLARLPEGTVLIDGLFGDGLSEYAVVPRAARDSLELAEGEFGDIDLVLVTHVHRDHFDPFAVERHLLSNPKAHLVAADQVVDSLRIHGRRFEEVRDRVRAVDASPGRTSELEVAGIPVRTFGVAHPPSRNEPVDHLAFVVGRSAPVAHLGDLWLESEGISSLASAGPVAAAFVPFWVVTGDGGARVREALEPSSLFGFHVGLGEEASTRRRFEESAPGAVLLTDPGLVVDDLPHRSRPMRTTYGTSRSSRMTP